MLINPNPINSEEKSPLLFSPILKTFLVWAFTNGIRLFILGLRPFKLASIGDTTLK